MVNIIRNTIGKGEIVHKAFPDTLDKIDIDRFVSSFDKLKNTTGWAPNVSLEKGIYKTVEYYKKYLGAYL
jgi:dTDP-D-glucose 4,6-dehydratase